MKRFVTLIVLAVAVLSMRGTTAKDKPPKVKVFLALPTRDGFTDDFLRDPNANLCEHLLHEAQPGSANHDTFTDSHEDITSEAGDTVAEQAVQHRFLFQLGSLAVECGNISDELRCLRVSGVRNLNAE